MKHLSIRNVPPEVARALESEKKLRGKSMNQTVLDLLRAALGLADRRTNGLEKLAGTWSEAEFEEFQRATAPFEEIDEELWR